MKDVRRKVAEAFGVTCFCGLALVSLFFICVYGAIGANTVVMSEPYKTTGLQIRSTDGTHILVYDGVLATLGLSFVQISFSGSYLFLFAFIVLIWAWSLLSIFVEDIIAFHNKLSTLTIVSVPEKKKEGE